MAQNACHFGDARLFGDHGGSRRAGVDHKGREVHAAAVAQLARGADSERTAAAVEIVRYCRSGSYVCVRSEPCRSLSPALELSARHAHGVDLEDVVSITRLIYPATPGRCVA